MAFDFPNAPTVGQVFNNWVWDGEKWLTQPAKGSKKNYIINGAMMVSQENGSTVGGFAFYPVDQFGLSWQGMSGVATVQQVASVTPSGSPNRVRVTVTTADTTVGAGDVAWLEHRIEGLRWADLRFGSAAAKTIVIQFGCKAPAGTYCVGVKNAAANRCYVGEYVISAGEANTDVVKSITLPGDVTGTWAADNTVGIVLNWGLMAGTTYQQAAGSWGTTNALGSPNQFNFMGTGGNTFELFDVSLTEGTIAPPFQVPDYASELALCKRYWQSGSWNLLIGVSVAGNHGMSPMFPVAMRAAPTASANSVANSGSGISGTTIDAITAANLRFYANVGVANIVIINCVTNLNARL